MGGSINLAFKFEDGKILNMYRHTGVAHRFIQNIKFINGDPEHLRIFLETGSNRISDHTTPDEYGFIAIDYKSKTVINLSDYGSIAKSTLNLLMPYQWIADKDERERNNCLLKRLEIENGYELAEKTMRPNKLSKKEFHNYYATEYIIPFSPWTVKDYNASSSTDINEALTQIRDLGFILTDKEYKEWQIFLDKAKSQEEE